MPPHNIPVGEAVFTSTYDEDGTVTSVKVIRADRVIAVSMELLEKAGPGARFRNGLLVLGTAGTHVYRPFRFSDQGEVVCELLG